MNILSEILSNPAVGAIGWTLVHACWQLLVLTSLYIGLKLLTKNPNIRYWAAMAGLGVQFLASGVTFFMELQTSSFAAVEVAFVSAKDYALWERVMLVIQPHLGIMAAVWLAGCVVLFARLIWGYSQVHRLKNHPLHTEEDSVTELLHTLKSQMNVLQKVEVKVSSLVNLPMIMGVVKPVILLPVSVATGFSTTQLEVIMAHELAHLKRQDFLINGFQSVLDVVYFFHPAMWWLSAQVRKERENCCDDMAVKYTGDKIILAKTLVQLQENAYVPTLALAFGKRSYTLLERVQRIVGVGKQSNITRESIWVLLGLFVSVFAFAQNTSQKQADEELLQTQMPVIEELVGITKNDTIIEPEKSEFKIEMNSDKHKVNISEDKIYIDKKEYPLSESDKVDFQKHMNAIKVKHVELNQATNEIQKKSQKISQYATQINVNTEPFSKIGAKMGELGSKMGQISAEYATKMSMPGISEKKRESLSKELEEEMKPLEKQMEAYEMEMDKLSDSFELPEAEMNKIEAEIAKLELPIEAISEEINVHVNAIMNLLPADIAKNIQIENFRGPKPPKPAKPMKPAKPSKMYAPAPPPPPPHGAAAPPPPPLKNK